MPSAPLAPERFRGTSTPAAHCQSGIADRKKSERRPAAVLLWERPASPRVPAARSWRGRRGGAPRASLGGACKISVQLQTGQEAEEYKSRSLPRSALGRRAELAGPLPQRLLPMNQLTWPLFKERQEERRASRGTDAARKVRLVRGLCVLAPFPILARWPDDGLKGDGEQLSMS